MIKLPVGAVFFPHPVFEFMCLHFVHFKIQGELLLLFLGKSIAVVIFYIYQLLHRDGGWEHRGNDGLIVIAYAGLLLRSVGGRAFLPVQQHADSGFGAIKQ